MFVFIIKIIFFKEFLLNYGRNNFEIDVSGELAKLRDHFRKDGSLSSLANKENVLPQTIAVVGMKKDIQNHSGLSTVTHDLITNQKEARLKLTQSFHINSSENRSVSKSLDIKKFTEKNTHVIDSVSNDAVDIISAKKNCSLI